MIFHRLTFYNVKLKNNLNTLIIQCHEIIDYADNFVSNIGNGTKVTLQKSNTSKEYLK